MVVSFHHPFLRLTTSSYNQPTIKLYGVNILQICVTNSIYIQCQRRWHSIVPALAYCFSERDTAEEHLERDGREAEGRKNKSISLWVLWAGHKLIDFFQIKKKDCLAFPGLYSIRSKDEGEGDSCPTNPLYTRSCIPENTTS